jgi:hypothetical protein
MLSLDVHYRCKWDMCISVYDDDGIGIIDIPEPNACFCSYLE